MLFAAVKSEEIVCTGDGSETFRIAVNLSLGDGADGIAAYIVTVRWDPEVLELVTDGGTSGCYFEDIQDEGWDMIPDASTTVNTGEIENGQLTVASGSTVNRKKSEGTLFLLEFRPKKVTAETVITVTPGSKNVTAENALSSATGKLENIKEETVLTLNVKGLQTLLGDVNGNGKIDAKDYMILKSFVLKKYKLSESEALAADVDGNGKINAGDYMMIKSHVLGRYQIHPTRSATTPET